MRFNFKYHSLFSNCILLNSILKYHGIQCGNRIKYEKQKKKKRFVYLKNFNDFLCIYLGEGRGGGGALKHVYIWEHIVSLYDRIA